MRYRLIIFDCDGVLVHSERIVGRVQAQLFRRFGLNWTEEDLRVRFKGRSMQAFIEEVEAAAEGALPTDWLYRLAMATADVLVRELQPVEGVTAVLKQLRQAGVRICVASQSPPERVRLCLDLCGLTPLVDGGIYTTSMVKHGKPRPDLFVHAAREEKVPAADCAVVEDSESGVLAGCAAGMDVFGYAGDGDAALLAAAGGTVFHSMDTLPELLGLPRR